jgi:TPR repeat protein
LDLICQFDPRDICEEKFMIGRIGCWPLIALSLLLTDAAQAGPFEDAVAAYQRKDYATALSLFRSLADKGDARAQGNVGAMYANGQGVPLDYAEAIKWYRRAADQGDAHAQYNLGVRYDRGGGVTQDYAEALKWYRLAAAKGDVLAHGNLGVLYANGHGVPQDYAEAITHIRFAAERGDPQS